MIASSETASESLGKRSPKHMVSLRDTRPAPLCPVSLYPSDESLGYFRMSLRDTRPAPLSPVVGEAIGSRLQAIGRIGPDSTAWHLLAVARFLLQPPTTNHQPPTTNYQLPTPTTNRLAACYIRVCYRRRMKHVRASIVHDHCGRVCVLGGQRGQRGRDVDVGERRQAGGNDRDWRRNRRELRNSPPASCNGI